MFLQWYLWRSTKLAFTDFLVGPTTDFGWRMNDDHLLRVDALIHVRIAIFTYLVITFIIFRPSKQRIIVNQPIFLVVEVILVFLSLIDSWSSWNIIEPICLISWLLLKKQGLLLSDSTAIYDSTAAITDTFVVKLVWLPNIGLVVWAAFISAIPWNCLFLGFLLLRDFSISFLDKISYWFGNQKCDQDEHY